MKNENIKRFIYCICFVLGILVADSCSCIPVKAETHIIHKDFLDPDIPREVQVSAQMIGQEYDICPELLMSIAYQESKYKENAISGDGSCWGIMQISYRWHKARMKRLGVTQQDLLKTYPCMLVAADYLKELFDTYEDDMVVLKKYNGDTSKGSSKYAELILERSAELEIKHGK